MPKVRDRQDNFQGGMNDRLAPERLEESSFSLGKNLETRYGGARSRRGSWLVSHGIEDRLSGRHEITGVGLYQSPNVGEDDQIVYSAYVPADDVTEVFRVSATVKNTIHAKVTLAETLSGKQAIRFVQSYDNLYAFRDGQKSMKWNGKASGSFVYVPAGVSGAMPNARDGEYAYNRLWLIENDDTIIAGDLLDENWSRSDNEIRIEQGDGTKVVAIRKFGNGNLVVFKERGIALLGNANNFATSADVLTQFIDDRVGCVAADTAISVGKDIFFLGREGVWTINQTSEQNAQLVEIPLSEPIYGLIQDINWLYVDTSHAVLHDNYYILSVPTGGSVIPNRLLVYDLLSKSWVGYWEYGELESLNDDNLQRFFRLLVLNSGKSNLVGVGGDCSILQLLRGDLTDRVYLQDTYYNKYSINPNYKFADFQFSATDLDHHINGTFSIRFGTATILTGDILVDHSSYTDVPAGDVGLYITSTTEGIQIRFRTGGSSAGEWVFDNFTVNGSFHELAITQNGSGIYAYLNGKPPIRTVSEAIDISAAGWLAATENITLFAGGWKVTDIRISTDEANATDAPDLVYWPLRDNGDATTTRYELNGDGTTSEEDETFKKRQSNSPFPGYSVVDDTAWATNETFYPVAIESVLKTRGYIFGGILYKKTGVNGELRFSHAQPSVTMERSSDEPFDSDIVESLNARTYSLVKYEKNKQADWDPTNSNDDFATPYREDYAPVSIDTELGENGFKVDVYKEHTELFSSLSSFDWVQFTLTNTQGFIRYSALSLEAEAHELQQDSGNQQ